MNRRLDIYLNGTDGLKDTFVDMLISWRNVPYFAPRAWRSLVDLWWDVLPLLIALLGPFFFWLAPVVAIFTAHKTLSDEEVRQRLRQLIHQNGG